MEHGELRNEIRREKIDCGKKYRRKEVGCISILFEYNVLNIMEKR